MVTFERGYNIMKSNIDINQLRKDLDELSPQDFEIKYPGLKNKSLKGLSVEELEQRISKTKGQWFPTKGGW